MSPSYEALVSTALCTRQLFESCSIARPLLKKLYIAYNPNVEIESYLDNATILFPRLNCGLATIYLQHVLRHGEIHNGAYDGQGHTFLKIEERIVDITADQFGGPSVYVWRVQRPWSWDK